MFAIRVHQPDEQGHDVLECMSYRVRHEPDGSTLMLLEKSQGAEQTIIVKPGGMAYVMGDSGKTVEVVRARGKVATLRGAVS